jgi:hypothetical protein
MKELTDHKGDVRNNEMIVHALADPGDDGMVYRYRVMGPNGCLFLLDFISGEFGTVSGNGVTDEALLAILIDRSEGRANEAATTALRAAMVALKQ